MGIEIQKNVQKTIESCAPYWAGEFEIAIRYFPAGSPLRSRENDVKWLEYQMFKEWTGSGVYGPRGVGVMDLITDAAEKITHARPLIELDKLHAICGQLEFAADELRHYTDLARLHQKFFPEPQQQLAGMGNLEDGVALTELRYDLRDVPYGKTAVALSEGGGLGLYFGILEVFENEPPATPFDEALLEIVKGIVEDERGHLAYNFRKAARAGFSDEAWDQIDALLQTISLQKLKERNQQFGYVLDEVGYRRIAAGESDWQSFVDKYIGFIYQYHDAEISALDNQQPPPWHKLTAVS